MEASASEGAASPSGAAAPSVDATAVAAARCEPAPTSETPSTGTGTGTPPSCARDPELVREVEEIRRLMDELARRLDQVIAQEQRLEGLELGTAADLLVLLTSQRSLRLLDGAPPRPLPIDEHIEDMIDPEFGLLPARTATMAAAERILDGYEALRWPARGPGRGWRSKPGGDHEP